MEKKVSYMLIISCLILATGIFLLSTKKSGGLDSLDASEKLWMICVDKGCNATFEVNKVEYFKWIRENRVGLYIPPKVCEKCGKESAFRAIKCDKCDFVFAFTSTDRCPKCNYSKIEDLKNNQ